MSKSLTLSRGITLVELVVASTLGVAAILALGQMDVARVKLFNELAQDRTKVEVSMEASVALDDILSDLKMADRIVLVAPGAGVSAKNVLIRIVEGEDFDNPANYRWVQYRFDNEHQRLEYYNFTPSHASDCTAAMEQGIPHVKNFWVKYTDIASAPMGGEPFPSGRDNNLVTVKIEPDAGSVRWGSTTVPAIPYSNLNTQWSAERGDSGTGLALVSMDPPAPCPRS